MAIAQRIWALINEDTVQNVIVCDTYPMADMLAKQTMGEKAFAVEITQIPTGVGDSYVDGVFKDKQGNIVQPLPTTEEEVLILKSENNALKLVIDDIILNGGMM